MWLFSYYPNPGHMFERQQFVSALMHLVCIQAVVSRNPKPNLYFGPKFNFNFIMIFHKIFLVMTPLPRELFSPKVILSLGYMNLATTKHAKQAPSGF
jgi:hypothetical protein